MNKIISIILLCFLSLLHSNTRVAFSRPGSLIRTPGALDLAYYNQYIVGFGGEITHLGGLNYALSNYFKGVTATGYSYGLSYTTGIKDISDFSGLATAPPTNLSFHIHKQVFKRNNIGINVGVHDILYTTDNPHRISLFTSFSYVQKLKNNYQLESVLGFGTGSLTSDSHDYTQSVTDADGVPFFLGFKLKTPLMMDKGGLNFLFEYDGVGLNLGSSIPLNDAWTINVAITNFANIAKFGEWGPDPGRLILPDSPALGIGIQMNIPKLKYKKVTSSVNDLTGLYSQIPYDESVDSLVRQATIIINGLEDSLSQQNQDHKTLQSINQSLKQRINYLEDSLSMVLLDDKIVQLNLNQAMKHLSQSLAYYYTQNYNNALEETDKAIALFPDLAIAYARKGSIYYRLGDVSRATVNWNIALTLDPEYEEVRNVLINLKDDEDLKTVILPE